MTISHLQKDNMLNRGFFLFCFLSILLNYSAQTPPFPSAASCGAIVNPGNNISPNIQSGEGYRWEVRHAENDTLVGVYDGILAESFNPGRNKFIFRFNWFKSIPYNIDYSLGVTYKVRVARRVAGVWGDYGTTCEMTPATNLWEGSVSTEWGNAANWTGGVPGVNSFAYIKNTSRKPSINGNVSVRNISFESVNTKLTVNSGSKLTIVRAINTNLSGVIIADGEIEFTTQADLTPNTFANNFINKLSINTTGGFPVALKGNLVVNELHINNGSLFIGNAFSTNVLTITGKMTRSESNTTNGIRCYTSIAGIHNFGNLELRCSENTSIFIEQTGGGNPTNILQSLILDTDKEIDLVGSVRVRNLNMKKGIINSSINNMLEIGMTVPFADAGSVTYSNGYVSGPVKKWFDGTGQEGILPVGENGYNKNVKIQFYDLPGGINGFVIAEFKLGMPDRNYEEDLPLLYLDGKNRKYIQNANEEGYWDITPYSSLGVAYGALNTNSYNLKLRLNHPPSTKEGPINFPESFKIIKSSYEDGVHGSWQVLDASIAHSIIEGYDYEISTLVPFGFSNFNIGANNNEPLPVVLNRFDAHCINENEVHINWSTSSENNSDYFEVFKSNDGENWNRVQKVQAAGFSQSLINYQIVDRIETGVYYKLVQYDYNGDFESFNPIYLNSCSDKTWQFSPNPFSDYLKIWSNDNLEESEISLSNMSGQIVFSEIKPTFQTYFQTVIDTKDLSSGVYLLSIKNKSSQEVYRLLKL